MLTALYIEALLVDAMLADAIWEIWSRRLVDDHTAIALWLAVAGEFSADVLVVLTLSLNAKRKTV